MINFSTRPNEKTKKNKTLTNQKVKLRTNKSSTEADEDWFWIIYNRSFLSAFNLALFVCFNICHTSKCFSICQWNFFNIFVFSSNFSLSSFDYFLAISSIVQGNAANSSETSMATQAGGSVTSRAASESRSGPPGSSGSAPGNSTAQTATGQKFRHGLLQLMIHTIDPLHDGKVHRTLSAIS